MKKATHAVAQAVAVNRARQVALASALSFASYVMLTQFVRAFFG